MKVHHERNGGPSSHRGTAAEPINATARKLDRRKHNPREPHRPIAVSGRAYPPAGRRTLWVLVVRVCPWCRGAHVHRSTGNGGIRTAGCGKGTYLVRPIDAGAVAA